MIVARKWGIEPKGFPTIRIFPSRPLPAGYPLKALRIVRKPNRVYVDLVYEVEKEPLPRCDSAVGIDLGVRKRAVLSTGERIERQRRDSQPGRRSSVSSEGWPVASGDRTAERSGSGNWHGSATASGSGTGMRATGPRLGSSVLTDSSPSRH